MFIVFDQGRPSDSPFVERVWTCHSERAGSFFSVASPLCEIVFTRLSGRIIVTLRGPETIARQVPCPSDGEWLAIRLKAGTFFPRFPTQRLIDGNDVNLPGVTRRSFWLDGASWECPDFDNAEEFVARLGRAGIIARDANVAAMLEGGDTQALSLRTIQRRFINLCGMSNCTVCRRYGVLWAYDFEGEGITVSGPTQAYIRGKAISFHFCPTCGCVAFWRSLRLEEDGRRRIAVNLRLTEPEAVAKIPIDHFDGLNSFEDLPRDGRCVADYWF